MALRSDGTQIAVAAERLQLSTLTTESFVAKLEANGTDDWETVVPGRTAGLSSANDVAFDPNGDIIVGGQIDNLETGRDFAVAREMFLVLSGPSRTMATALSYRRSLVMRLNVG